MTIQGNTTLLEVQRLYNREVRDKELVYYRSLLKRYGKTNKNIQKSHSYAINKLAQMSHLELDRGLSRALRLACFSKMKVNKLSRTTVSDIIYSVI